MLHWLRRGIDGWRLDAAYAVPPSFWAAVLPEVRKEFGEAWIVGEMIHGDYAGYVSRSGIDSVTQYELWHAIWSALHSVNLHELDWTLGRHRTLLEHLVPMTFLSNHDVTRVASQIRDRRHLTHAVALLGFLPGCRASTTGTSSASRRSRSSVPAVTTPSGPSCRPNEGCSPTTVRRSSPRTGRCSDCAGGTPGWSTPLSPPPRSPRTIWWFMQPLGATPTPASAWCSTWPTARTRLRFWGTVLESSSPLVAGAVAAHSWAVLRPADAKG